MHIAEPAKNIKINVSSMIPNDAVKCIPQSINDFSMINVENQSYAGFSEADKKKESFLFYWFFESSISSKGDVDAGDIPLVIWLGGGPGVSSIASLMQGNGPFSIRDKKTVTVEKNHHHWAQRAHVLYWDQTVGAGFSYSSIEKTLNDNSELSAQFCYALGVFFNKHPRYRHCPLYISGEGCGAKDATLIASAILENNKKTLQGQHINLKGIVIENGWMNPRIQLQSQIDHAFAVGNLDYHHKQIMEAKYAAFCRALNQKEMVEAYERACAISQTIQNYGGLKKMADLRTVTNKDSDCLNAYMNSEATKRAINVPPDRRWINSGENGATPNSQIERIMKDDSSRLSQLLDAPVDVLFYVHSVDESGCFMACDKTLYNLRWNHQMEWQEKPRKIWKNASNETLGFVKQVKNLSQIFISESIENRKIDQSERCQSMFYHWLFKDEFLGQYPEVN